MFLNKQSYLLIDLLERNSLEVDLKGKRCLELGSGCGLVSIAASDLFSFVFASDLPEVLDLTEKNIAQNEKTNVKAVTLDWLICKKDKRRGNRECVKS